MGYSPEQQVIGKMVQQNQGYFYPPVPPLPCDMPIWTPGFLDSPLQWARKVSPYWADAFIISMILIGFLMFSFYFPPTRFAWELIFNIFRTSWQTAKGQK